MVLLLLLHATFAVLGPLVIHRLGRRGFWVLALPSAATFVWALTQSPAVLSGSQALIPVESHRWVSTIGLDLVFRLDALSWLLTLVAGGIGALVLVYCSAYFEADEPGLGRFAGCLTGFSGAMLGLVTADNMLVLYIFWELTTVLSYLLVGHKPESTAGRSAATQALVVTTFGGLAMLVGIILIGEQNHTYLRSEILAQARHGSLDLSVVTVWGVVLILLGAVSKSALVPFHFWLPGAMAAPTPVSAYLHAAAMVKAGVYLVARLAPAYADLPAWKITVLVLGGATMLIGAYRSLRQHDLKLLLAYGTVSQLGFLILLVGAGTSDAALAGVTMLLAHALYKGGLFLVVGTIDHAAGTRDLRELSGLRRSMPWLAVAATVCAASMAGLPPLLGFIGKEAAYAAFADHLGSGPAETPWVLAVLVVGSICTVAYSARFVWGAFRTDPAIAPTPVHRPGPVLVGVPLVLAACTLVAGLAPSVLEPALRAYADTVGPTPAEGHLALWHGINLTLMLTLLTWLAGAALYAGRRPVEAAQARMPNVPSAEGAYRVVMRSLDRSSLEVTGAVQRGSLPLSLGLILLVFLVLPGGAVLLTTHWSALPVQLADSPAQVIVAALTAVAAIAAVRSRRRLRAVLLVGVTGYACALIFLLDGAPDLALTQVLVESVSIIVFVLVLRRLSGRFNDDSSRANRVMRACFGTAVGVAATALCLAIPPARTAPPASTGLADAAVTYGGGDNIVNVILVDVRAWDTMGELSVVLAAATGIASLVFLREDNVQRARDAMRAMRGYIRRVGHDEEPTVGSWLSQVRRGEARRSLMLEVVTRLVFHVMLVWSIYLLFAGHNSPGGGFAAGLVAGMAIALRYLAGGRRELAAAVPVMPGLLLGIGLFLAVGTGLASMLVGGSVLQTWIFDVPVPLIGKVHVVTSLVFDIGVYLVVIGLMLDILRSLGSALDIQIEAEQAEKNAGSSENATDFTRPAEPIRGSTP